MSFELYPHWCRFSLQLPTCARNLLKDFQVNQDNSCRMRSVAVCGLQYTAICNTDSVSLLQRCKKSTCAYKVVLLTREATYLEQSKLLKAENTAKSGRHFAACLPVEVRTCVRQPAAWDTRRDMYIDTFWNIIIRVVFSEVEMPVHISTFIKDLMLTITMSMRQCQQEI